MPMSQLQDERIWVDVNYPPSTYKVSDPTKAIRSADFK